MLILLFGVRGASIVLVVLWTVRQGFFVAWVIVQIILALIKNYFRAIVIGLWFYSCFRRLLLIGVYSVLYFVFLSLVKLKLFVSIVIVVLCSIRFLRFYFTILDLILIQSVLLCNWLMAAFSNLKEGFISYLSALSLLMTNYQTVTG